LPGGHLEMGETWEQCSTRELLEETNLLIKNVKFVGATNDIAIGGNLNKHYVTIFMAAEVSEESGPLQNLEPEKCEGWEWISMENLCQMGQEAPSLIFDPLLHYLQSHDLREI
jgi:8-oxo-dGTP diphosphatase